MTMRDAYFEKVADAMASRNDVVIVSADLGAPALDRIRTGFHDRFVNVGIAEQNLIAVSLGLALEGCTVIAYAIAPFLTMRACEQIRTNLSIHAQVRDIAVSLVGLGAGLSYGMSGPTHHSLEDISAIRMLPNIGVYVPSDWKIAGECANVSLTMRGVNYFRFDSKINEALPFVTDSTSDTVTRGFRVLSHVPAAPCIISSGYMTHRISRFVREHSFSVTHIDIVRYDHKTCASLRAYLSGSDRVITAEEGFTGAAGLDALIREYCSNEVISTHIISFSFPKRHLFETGSREEIHAAAGLSDENLRAAIEGVI